MRESEPLQINAATGRADEAYLPDCEVFEGRTTSFDVVRAGASACVLIGSLTYGSAPLTGWSAALYASDVQGRMRDVPIRSAELDAIGGFRIEMPAPGEYVLKLQSPSEVRLYSRVSLLSGPNTWERSIECGELRIVGAPRFGTGQQVWCHRWVGPNGDEVIHWIDGQDLGVASLVDVPIGKGQVVSRELSGRTALYAKGWTVHCETEVVAGESRSVDCPR
jgi:hypothetical protein